jgi:hypothetical protein
MKMMISAARRAIGRQYILITPQAMNSIQSVGDVKIIKCVGPTVLCRDITNDLLGCTTLSADRQLLILDDDERPHWWRRFDIIEIWEISGTRRGWHWVGIFAYSSGCMIPR